MFTLKFYSDNGLRQRVLSAESLTILRAEDGAAEVTLHQKNTNEDTRIDISWDLPSTSYAPPTYQQVIVENAAGKTTEIITLGPDPKDLPKNQPKDRPKAA